MDRIADVASALAAIPDHELDALRTTIDTTADFPSGLIAWLEHAVGWEIDQRSGRNYRLQGPRSAIDDRELDVSLNALAMLAIQFGGGGHLDSDAVADFLEISAATLRAEVERPDRLQ